MTEKRSPLVVGNEVPSVPSPADVDLLACTTAKQWLEAAKQIDPRLASDAVVAQLEDVVASGPHVDANDEQQVVIRERAAMCLKRSAAIKGAAFCEAFCERVLVHLRRASDPMARRSWASTLIGLSLDPGIIAALKVLVDREEDPRALIQLYRAWANDPDEPPQETLIAWAKDEDEAVRKRAYAYLAETASPELLRRFLLHEEHPSAQRLLEQCIDNSEEQDEWDHLLRKC